jgi:ADP-heptose:LPS heptosyltransferase
MGDRGNSLLRFFDRFAGIPLVFLLGLFVRKKKIPHKINRIAILATAAIGDTILISAVLKDLITVCTDSSLTVYCGKTNRATFEMAIPHLNLITIPVNNPLKAIKIIRQKRYDLFIDFGPWPRINSLLSHFSLAPCKIGFKSIKQYRHYIYNIAIEHRNDCHEIENLRRLVIPLGISSHSLPALGEPKVDLDNPYIVIHMFPSGYKASYKEWSDNNWVTLINALAIEGYNITLTGAPVDKEACERIAEKCSHRQNITIMAGKTNLKQTGELLQNALMVISVNTGIMHMAAAYNQIVIGLHGPTSVKRWGPLCERSYNFTANTPGAGCLHLGFEYDNSDPHSMDSIDPIKVAEKSLVILKEYFPSTH